ncbi:MAG: translesion DNA synthesis-associated protein ImuA [Gammaproteobacteria bacterium]
MDLAELMSHAPLWRAADAPRTAVHAVASGHTALDARLPGGGWPCGALTEILSAREGIGALRLVLPALASIGRAGRWVVFVAPPYRPYAPALAAAGVDLQRLLLVCESDRRRALWALEQALRCGAAGAVLGWPDEISMPALRRLQLAAEAGDALGFLFRPAAREAAASPAALRLVLQAGAGGVTARIAKCRMGRACAPFLLVPMPSVVVAGADGQG